MDLFPRRRTRSVADQMGATVSFWTWWNAEGATAVEAAMASGDGAAALELLRPHVVAIHPSLAYEVSTRRFGDRVLVVSSEGNPDLRPIAARWLRAAPEAGVQWSFADARQPAADLDSVVIGLSGHELPATRTLVGARVNGVAVDVTLYHPGFAELSEQERRVAGFLLLDAALGEKAVETWIGEINITEHPLPDAIGLGFLSMVTDEVASGAVDGDGKPLWAVMEGVDASGNAVLARAQVPLKSVIAGHLDTHVGVWGCPSRLAPKIVGPLRNRPKPWKPSRRHCKPRSARTGG